MQRASTSNDASPSLSAAAREALDAFALPAEEAQALHDAVHRTLKGRGSRRRDAEQGLLSDPRFDTARAVPLILAVRDQIVRTGPTPRGLGRRVDGLLRAVADGRAATGRNRRRGRPGAKGGSARSLFRAVLEATPEAVLTLDVRGRVGLWNRAGAKMTGWERAALLQKGPAVLFPKADALDGLLEEIRETGRLEPRETTLRHRDDEEVPARVRGVRLGAEKDSGRCLLLFQDLTELHRIRERLIDTEKLSAMAKIAGSVAHEFRNPLNSLFLSTDLLEDELSGHGSVAEAIQPTLAAIREEIERLNQIITHYLSLSKVATHTPEVVDLGELAQEFAEEWRERTEDRGAEIRVRIHDGDLLVSADPNQVRRVMVNLVENAVDALNDDEDGTTDEKPKTGNITLDVRPLSRSVKLTVRDRGPGIPEDIREQVFEPFFTSKSRGSGLGLYLVREILLAHGGAIALGGGGKGTSVATHWPRPTGSDA